MSISPQSNRPVHLNLFKVRLPVGGVMSIIHRITGVILFLAIPLMIYLLDHSLISEAGFNQVVVQAHTTLGSVLLLGLMWALSHHLLAGIRHLFIDVDLGVDKPTARMTALVVILVAPVLGLALTWGLL